jgi:large subunit ribosomal protein L21
MSYAIFVAQGQQFKAEKGRTLRIPLMEGEPGAKLTFDQVLLSSSGEKVHTGTPLVKGAQVTAEIVGQVKGTKLQVFRFKRRKGYRRKTGHRQRYTEIKVTSVRVGG